MPSRGYLIPALVLWFVATGRLVKTKILPTLTSGSPPDYGETLPRPAGTLEPVRWAIRWNERDIGWAENRISRNIDGTGSVVSEVQLALIEATVEAEELIGWNGQLVKTKVVTYRGDAGSGLSSTRTPLSHVSQLVLCQNWIIGLAAGR